MKMIPKPQKARPHYWGPNGAADARQRGEYDVPTGLTPMEEVGHIASAMQSQEEPPPHPDMERLGDDFIRAISEASGVPKWMLLGQPRPPQVGKSHWGPLQTVGSILTQENNS